MIYRLLAGARFFLVLCSCFSWSTAETRAGDLHTPIVLNDDGAWCWFQDERALVHQSTLLVASVANGSKEKSRCGDIELVAYDFVTRRSTRSELHDQLEPDDHAAPALWLSGDGRLLAVYAMHGQENCFYVRRTCKPSVFTEWLPESTYVPSEPSRITYSNLHFLALENEGRGRLYNLFRGLDASFKPSYAFSQDDGMAWQCGNVAINVPLAFKHRPYVKYASNGRDTIHLLFTNGHPRNFDNSLYHVFYRDGQLHRSDGTVIGPLSHGLKSPDDGTRIFLGDAQNVAWVSDVHLSDRGHPYVVFSVQKDSAGLPSSDERAGQDHRYRYAWWDGAAWHDHELAHGGSRLYAGEDDYTGNICLDPDRLDTAYFSTNVHPVTGLPLISSADKQRHYEIYCGRSSDGGRSWSFVPITHDSAVDNLRPIVPKRSNNRTALLWFRGKYITYRNYQTEVVALILDDIN